MSVLRFSLRATRKIAHVSNKILRKGTNLTERVESKTTRMLSGADYSMRVNERIPLEQVLYASTPQILPIHASMPAVGSKPTVTLLIPSLDGGSFFGGTATALIVAARCAQILGRKLRIVQTLKTGNPGDLVSFFASEGIIIDKDNIQVISIADRAYNIYGYISTHKKDVFIASAWWDAHNLSRMPLKQRFIYLVQDFEPIFYNNGDLYARAEETYKGDRFVPLCNTKLMADFMVNQGYSPFQNPAFFEPAVSRRSAPPTKKKSGEKKVLLLYGRPNVHRNMFFTALQAIDHAFKANFILPKEWECYMAGQDNLPDITLPSGVTIKNMGKMDMKDYVEFTKSVDLAISPMMAPHPNYPTLEFASSGSMVVTTKYKNKQSLDCYSKNIIMSDLSIESMADAINVAISKTDKQRLADLKTTIVPDNWRDSIDNPIKQVLKEIVD